MTLLDWINQWVFGEPDANPPDTLRVPKPRTGEEIVQWQDAPACDACEIEYLNATYLFTYEVAYYPDEVLCDDHRARAEDGRQEDRRPRPDDD